MKTSRRTALGIRHLAPLLLLLAPVACQGGGSRAHQPARDTGESVSTGSQGVAIELLRSPERDEIARLEDHRSLGDGRLVELLGHEDPGVRARAALALGRFAFPDFGAGVTNALCQALEDSDAEVRATAVFALGLRADPASAGVLFAYRNDPDPRIRIRVIEAAGRIDQPGLRREQLVALRDSDPAVRMEVASAAALWNREDPDAEQVDRALLDALRPYTISSRAPGSAERPKEPELRWRLLYALARRKAELGRGAFLEYLVSDQPLERLFAARGLGRIETRPESVAALARVLTEETGTGADWRVAYEAAVGLGLLAAPEGLEALLGAVEHESAHVRAAALEALHGFTDRSRILPKLRRGLMDLSTSANTAAMRSIARVLPPEDALKALRKEARSSDAIVRAGAAEAAGLIEDEAARPLLLRLAEDPNPLVAGRAIEGLGGHPAPEIRTALRAFLEHEDNGRRLAAVGALGAMPDLADVEALEAAFRTTTGDLSTEVAFHVLDTLAAIGGPKARALHKEAARDPRPHVRRTARRNLRESFGVAPPTDAPAPLELADPTPLPGEGYENWTRNPLVEVRTNLGPLVFELFPAEAPLHVASFLELAKAGHYDGLVFHRVVPDFVVQGGDYRGDGNGAAPWRGEALRQEFTPRKYVRGSLGMPRNADPDSGGSQFFVTHRPTPHLDGRYTIFGELRAGGEVLDRIQVGDRIVGIRLLP